MILLVTVILYERSVISQTYPRTMPCIARGCSDFKICPLFPELKIHLRGISFIKNIKNGRFFQDG